MSNEHDPKPKPEQSVPEVPGGPSATPDTPEGRAAAREEGEEA